MTRILYLDVEAPCAFINSNGRLHRLAVARLAAQWRQAGREAVPAHAEPFTGRVRVLAHIWKPSKRRYDPNNVWPTIKAACDGALVDTGLIPDDDHEHMLGPDMRHGGYGKPRIVIEIQEVP